jgi:hypothetical protein
LLLACAASPAFFFALSPFPARRRPDPPSFAELLLLALMLLLFEDDDPGVAPRGDLRPTLELPTPVPPLPLPPTPTPPPLLPPPLLPLFPDELLAGGNSDADADDDADEEDDDDPELLLGGVRRRFRGTALPTEAPPIWFSEWKLW